MENSQEIKTYLTCILVTLGFLSAGILTVAASEMEPQLNISAKAWRECDKKALDADKMLCQKRLIDEAQGKQEKCK